MDDREALRDRWAGLKETLDRQTSHADLHRLYLDVAFLAGQLQGAVSEAKRQAGASTDTGALDAALDALKERVRRVGLDIRLASPADLALGLRVALDRAAAVLAELERIEGGGG